MYPRVNFEMTQEDFDTLLKSMQPTPLIMLQCGGASDPQERANAAWAALGKKMGFDYMTVWPVKDMGPRFFTAVPSETDEQRKMREAQQVKDARQANIAKLESEIEALQHALTELHRTPL